MLRKLLLVAIATTPRDASEPERADGDAANVVACLTRLWEWIDVIVAPPEQPALAAAGLLGPVSIEPAFGSTQWLRERGVDQALAAHVRPGLERLEASAVDSALVFADPAIVRAIWSALCEVPLPPERPASGDLVLLTRRADGAWRPGRSSSNPPPLRDALERDGVASACALAVAPRDERALLQIRDVRRPTLG